MSIASQVSIKLKYRLHISEENLASKLRYAVSVKYIPYFKNSMKKQNMKLMMFILITY